MQIEKEIFSTKQIPGTLYAVPSSWGFDGKENVSAASENILKTILAEIALVLQALD